MAEGKGWSGWVSERGGRVNDFPTGHYDIPVWIIPLDPDGPKPGEERLDFDGDRVTILHPHVIDSLGNVASWWVKQGGNERWTNYTVNTEDLSPIPRTRTVTVELTDEEAMRVTRLANAGCVPTWSPASLFHKLAAALENE